MSWIDDEIKMIRRDLEKAGQKFKEIFGVRDPVSLAIDLNYFLNLSLPGNAKIVSKKGIDVIEDHVFSFGRSIKAELSPDDNTNEHWIAIETEHMHHLHYIGYLYHIHLAKSKKRRDEQ